MRAKTALMEICAGDASKGDFGLVNVYALNAGRFEIYHKKVMIVSILQLKRNFLFYTVESGRRVRMTVGTWKMRMWFVGNWVTLAAVVLLVRIMGKFAGEFG